MSLATWSCAAFQRTTTRSYRLQRPYPISVEITRNDTGEVIYTSKAVPVGSKIENDTLDVDLDASTYECTAMFFNLDPVTGDKLGSAGVVIELTVLE